MSPLAGGHCVPLVAASACPPASGLTKMTDSTPIPTASNYSITRAGQVYSHRTFGGSTKRRSHQLTPYMHQGHRCYSIIHDCGTKRNRKIAELLKLTFGDD